MGAFPGLRPSRPADWEVGMTVCIAAIAENETIVTAQDLMLSMSTFSADKIALKTFRIAASWWAMIAAEETSYVTSILSRATSFLQAAENNFEDVRRSFTQAYLDERQNQSEEQVLGFYNINMDRFLRENTQMFTQEEYRELYGRIRNVRLGCSFLVFGFDNYQKAHIFEVSEALGGEVSDKVMDEVGFWAVGSGQYSALSILSSTSTDHIENFQLPSTECARQSLWRSLPKALESILSFLPISPTSKSVSSDKTR